MARLVTWCWCGARAQVTREVLQAHENQLGLPCPAAGARAPRAGVLVPVGARLVLPSELLHP